MADIPPYPLNSDAESSAPLNQRLTRGGVVTARLTAGVAGTYWLAPRDSMSRSMGFTVAPAADAVTVTPGDDNAPAGFWVAPGGGHIEFGGASQRPLIQDEWWVTFDGPGSLDMVIYRDS